MREYIVAKANQTAQFFVARSEKERDGWIILYRTRNYLQACAIRDRANVR